MRVPTKSISIVLLAALLGLSVACSKSKPSDDAITKDVETKLAADPDTKDSQVTVVAKEGKVTLAGKVKTPASKRKWNRSPRKSREWQPWMIRSRSSLLPNRRPNR